MNIWALGDVCERVQRIIFELVIQEETVFPSVYALCMLMTGDGFDIRLIS